MDKIRDLIKNIGASEELANSICEEFERWLETKEDEYTQKESALNEDFTKRLKRAKQVCLEEVEQEKRVIAQKVEIFLENKAGSIEKAMSKQRALDESKATNDLKKVKAILEGVAIKGGIDSTKHDAIVKEVAKLKRSLTTLSEDRDGAVAKANRATKIATNVLRKNKLLETKLRANGVVVEEETKSGRTLKEAAEKNKSGTPKSTRRVDAEAQMKQPITEEKKSAGRQGCGEVSIQEIADRIGDIP